MTTNGQFEETYKGWIISSGIFLPDTMKYNVHVYKDAEAKRNIEPSFITVSVDAAKRWIDEEAGASTSRTWEEFTGRTSYSLRQYYWQLHDMVTSEVMQSSKPHNTVMEAVQAAREYNELREYGVQNNLVICRVYDNDFYMTPGFKDEKPVYEAAIVVGITREVGVTQLQSNALARLWPYTVHDYHSDGDLTVMSNGRLYVVTTEGGVFEEKDMGGLRGY